MKKLILLFIFCFSQASFSQQNEPKDIASEMATYVGHTKDLLDSRMYTLDLLKLKLKVCVDKDNTPKENNNYFLMHCQALALEFGHRVTFINSAGNLASSFAVTVQKMGAYQTCLNQRKRGPRKCLNMYIKNLKAPFKDTYKRFIVDKDDDQSK